MNSGYKGGYPINPEADEILGLKCSKSYHSARPDDAAVGRAG
jgi:acyl-CoA synthetase (NDP forming)